MNKYLPFSFEDAGGEGVGGVVGVIEGGLVVNSYATYLVTLLREGCESCGKLTEINGA